MPSWNANPLFRVVFAEIRGLWDELDPTDRPLILRVEQGTFTVNWNGPHVNGRLLSVWLFDDYGPRLAPVLSREPHDFGQTRGRFSDYGLVRFAIAAERDRLVLEYKLGPEIGGAIHYDVEEADGEIRLLANSGTVA